MQRSSGEYPKLMALHERIAADPRIAAYLESERRIAFNEEGIFRHYDELDAPR
jgi:glutathione S-transferase